jgi:glutamate dehydrogenase
MLVKVELLDKVVARIREQMPEDQAPQVEEFARQYYGWVDAADLEDRSPIDAYGAALCHWSFAGRREPGERKIRVYNPHFEEHGWQSTHTVIEMVNDDMPFLVDSTRMEVNRQGYAIHMILHPVMNVRRDEEGLLLEVLPPDADEEDVISESVIHVEVDRQTEPFVLEDLKQAIQKTLADVKAAVEDWPQMRKRIGDIVSGFEENPPDFEPEDLAETRAFLEWIDDDNFTFLGYREYDLTTQNGEEALCAVQGSGLGILRQTESGPVSHSFAELPPEVRRLARTHKLLNLTKANSRATVQAFIPGLHRYQEIRRVGRGHGRAAVPGTVHLHRLQLERLRHPARQTQGALRSGEGRVPRGEPQREGSDRDPGDLPARRAVPGLQ